MILSAIGVSRFPSMATSPNRYERIGFALAVDFIVLFLLFAFVDWMGWEAIDRPAVVALIAWLVVAPVDLTAMRLGEIEDKAKKERQVERERKYAELLDMRPTPSAELNRLAREEFEDQ